MNLKKRNYGENTFFTCNAKLRQTLNLDLFKHFEESLKSPEV